MADTHQRWVCPNDSWEEDARCSPLVAVPWNLLADHSRKSHGRPSLLPSDAQGLCFFRRGDLSSDHGRMFSDAALSYSSLSLHIAPPRSTVKSSLEGSPALLLSLFLSWQVFPGLVLAPSHLDTPTMPLAGRLTSSFPLHAPATWIYWKHCVAHVILLFMNCQSLHCL